MIKKILLSFCVIAASLVLSGCSMPGSATNKDTIANATFIRSDDDSGTWNSKIKINDKKSIAGIDVLSMAINPNDPNNVYLGTSANGLFITKDAGETWTNAAFADKAYGLVFDPSNPNVMYGSGVFNGRGKIYKRTSEGEQWKEIYTEPANGTLISALAIDKMNPRVLFAGTSGGVIIRSTDGGQTWTNLKISGSLNAPITAIAFDAGNDGHVYFLAFQSGLFETRDGGATVNDISKLNDTVGSLSNVYTITSDPYFPGVLYIGTSSGIFRRTPDGKWNELNIIESSKAFEIRTIAINPKNSKEIIYAASRAIYKSTDAGNTWATFQLDTTKDISVIRFNPNDPTKIYAGLRSF